MAVVTVVAATFYAKVGSLASVLEEQIPLHPAVTEARIAVALSEASWAAE